MADRVLGYLSTAILFLDDRLNILFANQASETLLEESYAHMEGRPLTEIIGNGSDLALVIRAAVDSNKLITRRQMPLVLGQPLLRDATRRELRLVAMHVLRRVVERFLIVR